MDRRRDDSRDYGMDRHRRRDDTRDGDRHRRDRDADRESGRGRDRNLTGRDRGSDRRRSRSRERGGRGAEGRRSRSRSPPRRHFREAAMPDIPDRGRDAGKAKERGDIRQEESTAKEGDGKDSKDTAREEAAALSKAKLQEAREQEKNKLRSRLDLLRQMKGDEDMGEEDMDDEPELDDQDLEEMTEEQQMMRLMGFKGFSSTKGQAVADNQKGAAKGAVSKNKKRQYRQYMNRRGGFNRPLAKMS